MVGMSLVCAKMSQRPGFWGKVVKMRLVRHAKTSCRALEPQTHVKSLGLCSEGSRKSLGMLDVAGVRQ